MCLVSSVSWISAPSHLALSNSGKLCDVLFRSLAVKGAGTDRLACQEIIFHFKDRFSPLRYLHYVVIY